MTRDERALLLSMACAMAEILEAGAAPLDTIGDHGREIRALLDRLQEQEKEEGLIRHFERRRRPKPPPPSLRPRAAPDPGPTPL
ncbi:hypothetical protein [Plastoroseomonas hellenica]|uniref:hypothetical protein n=1 Tax=Plastoroseomonas hellenica TaxID=2687306 RepID=UPI001BA8D2B8|nr:hypothetical protein [Plastoroseomonas hellenica]MBR0646171.1 hypothetical protein [Plastoroseomonas hellenica]